jgi:thiamine biosynthesis lipoprotein ApbE/Na+-translocating ferredoxin:NAD+ oxidoreductase RnfG subunit
MISLLLLLFCQDGAQVFLSEEEAVRKVFPREMKVLRRDVQLPVEVHDAVRRRIRRRVEDRYRLYLGVKNDKVVRYAIVTDEVTKTLTMTFIVGVDPDGKVTDVVVMEHREKVGAEVAKKRFLRQFRGKDLDDPIQRNRDMIAIVGATLSCDAAMRGTRKVLAVIREYLLDRPENVSSLITAAAPVKEERYVMGSLCSITAYGSSDAVDAAFREIRRWDGILSNYDPESELSRLNRARTSEVSPELLRFLRECDDFRRSSGGAFDVAVGSLVRAWGFPERNYRLPSDGELQKGTRDRAFRIEGNLVSLEANAELDPGAIGKGFAVDRAVEALRKAGVTSAFVDFGSTVYALGTPPGEAGWTVAVRDPFRKKKILGTIVLRDSALATSGDYEKYFELEGRRYCHILDPRTGRTVEGVASVSLLAKSATEADALSTSIFVRGFAAAEGACMFVSSDPRAPVSMTPSWREGFHFRSAP